MKSVFLLWHVRQKGADVEDLKLIGVYSEKQRAELAMKRLKEKPGFRDHPHGFEIAETTLNRDSWTEGFGFDV